MRTTTFSIPCRTRGEGHIVNLTEALQEELAATRIETGQATAMVVGSTAALTTTEFEPGLVEHDLSAVFEGIAPREGRYEHERTWGDDNGHSHVRASLVGPSLALPVVGGRVPFGTWQQLVLMEFDTRSRDREVVVSVLGE